MVIRNETTEFSIVLWISSTVLRGGQQCLLGLAMCPFLGKELRTLVGKRYTRLCNAQDSAWQQSTLKGFLPALK